MKFYWSLKQVPELSGLSCAERGKVHRACYVRHALKSRRCLLALAACGLCAGAGSAMGSLSHVVFGTPFALWQPVVGGAVGGGVGGLIFGQIVTDYLRPFYADYIRNELRAGGV